MHEDDTFDDLESIADVSEHPSKRQKTANACTMCGAPNKYVKEAGIHTKAGWCGPSQEFSIRKSNDDRPSAGERLRKLKTRVQVEQDKDAAALLQAVRAGHVDGVTARLKARPELMLMPVWGVSRKDPSRPLWEWSVLHEALNKVGDGPSSVGVVKALLQHCGRNGVLLTTLRPKSDSWATPLHEAAYRGSICCIELLLAAGADLFAKTRSDWLRAERLLSNPVSPISQ